MQSRPILLQRRLTEDPKRVQGYNPPVPGVRAVSFIDGITVILRPERSLDMTAINREVYGMAAGTPEGRTHIVEPKEIAGPASRWS